MWAEKTAMKKIAADLPQYNVRRLELFAPIKVGEYDII